MVCIFCVVVSGDGYILGGDGWWWMRWVVGGVTVYNSLLRRNIVFLS